MFSTRVTIPGYQVSEEIYNGSRTIVYRGYRETDSLPVAIKLLKNLYLTFNELVQLRNQYTIAKNLNSSLIIQSYCLEMYQNGYALVMKDFDGISLKDYFDRDKTLGIRSLQEFLQIAIALCHTLYRFFVKLHIIPPPAIAVLPMPWGTIGGYYYVYLHTELVLDILDSQRILHKGIKASNILINPEIKQVKLIDFSIASLLPRETQTLFALLIPVRQ
ncbi:MAG: hypothetical protein V7L26_15205 [Nostoc sp.]